MSTGKTNIFQNAVSVDVSDEFDVYTKVIINIDDETYVEAGDDTGRALELDCPWGTQEMASNILTSLQGYQYQPLTATGALLDPSYGIGDGIQANGEYSGIFSLTTSFGTLMSTEVSAPTENSIDHELPYVTSTNKRITRQEKETKATFEVMSDQISAKVEKENTNTSFGWKLTDTSWTVNDQSGTILTATSSGLEIKGKITATSGFIGTSSDGFVITSSAIYKNTDSLEPPEGTSKKSGVYIGTDGISLGWGNFKVDSSGNLTATSGTFSGKVYAGQIQYGGSYGTVDGYALTNGTVTRAQTSTTINGQLNQGVEANSIAYISNGEKTVTSANITGGIIAAKTLSTSTFTINSTQFSMLNAAGSLRTVYLGSITMPSGNNEYVVKWA